MCPKCSMYPFCFASSNSTTNDVGHFVMHRQDSWPPTKAGRIFKHVAQFPFPAEWGCLHTLKEDTSIFSLQRMCCGGIYHWWHRDTNVGSWGRSVSVWRKYVHDLLCPGLSSFDSATSSTLTAPISNLSLLSMLTDPSNTPSLYSAPSDKPSNLVFPLFPLKVVTNFDVPLQLLSASFNPNCSSLLSSLSNSCLSASVMLSSELLVPFSCAPRPSFPVGTR